MKIHLRTKQPVETFEELHEHLIARIPQADRELFFHPPTPQALTSELHGIAPAPLAAAVERIKIAIEKQEQVVIFGDYDCDGVTATAILWETLRSAGIVARPFLPHRERHGYGLSVKALEEVFAQGKPDLLITVDNGIVAHESFAWLKEQGVFTILTDHHSPSETLPDANIIIHSTLLCGATVSWMLANALSPEFAAAQLDLAVLGTIADQVPLVGANRSFAVHGLKALQKTKRASLLALAKAAGIDLQKATTHSIHYGLAPRINAMGRLYDALDALRALVSRNPERIADLANQLQEVNKERQTVTHEAFQEIQMQFPKHQNDPFLVISGPYHEGVIGLLASKIVEATGKPAIVVSNLGDVAKASCRSFPGVNMTEFLRSLPEVAYLSLGGHAQAAGFSLSLENYEENLEKIRVAARERYRPEDFIVHKEVLCSLHGSLLHPDVLTVLESFAPFGSANEEPLFLLENVRILSHEPLGKGGTHRRLRIQAQGAENPCAAVVFQTDKRMPQIAESMNLVVKLQNSSYRPGMLDILVEGVCEKEEITNVDTARGE